MKYAVNYTRSFRHYDEVDEVVFLYTGAENDDALIQAVTETLSPEQRAIINIGTGLDTIVKEKTIEELIVVFNKLKQEHSNLTIAIDFYFQRDFITPLKENEIDYMFINPAVNFSTVCAMYGLGATDIYVAEEICFSLNKLQSFRKNGVKIRLFPDIAQVARGCNDILPQITKFWVRPEDLDLYEDYIDVVEIFRRDARTSVVYEIYKSGRWLGKISDLILDLNLDIPNTSFVPNFGQSRLNCNKQCSYNKCVICQRTLELAGKLEEADLQIIKQKKKKIDTYTEKEKEKIINELKAD